MWGIHQWQVDLTVEYHHINTKMPLKVSSVWWLSRSCTGWAKCQHVNLMQWRLTLSIKFTVWVSCCGWSMFHNHESRHDDEIPREAYSTWQVLPCGESINAMRWLFSKFKQQIGQKGHWPVKLFTFPPIWHRWNATTINLSNCLPTPQRYVCIVVHCNQL